MLRRRVESAQDLSIRDIERLGEAGVAAPVGGRGDADDHALAKSVIGLYQIEVIRHAGPRRAIEDVECATTEWVAWCNQQRLLARLG